MVNGDPLAELRAYVDARWAVIQPVLFPDCREVRVRIAELTSREAEWFLASVTPHDDNRPLFKVEDNNNVPSDRCPPNADGTLRRGAFFEKYGSVCILRLETIVHTAATWRLHDEFGWPIEHLIVESPDVVDKDGHKVILREALDILALDRPCPQPPSKMTVAAARSRVAVEAKADEKLLNNLLHGMQACQGQSEGQHKDTDHKKCRGLQVFRPRLLLGVAAGETCRLFSVKESHGRTLLQPQQNLDCLNFNQ